MHWLKVCSFCYVLGEVLTKTITAKAYSLNNSDSIQYAKFNCGFNLNLDPVSGLHKVEIATKITYEKI